MSVLKLGRGKPLTLFAPGGNGENLDVRMSYTGHVKGTKIGFAYEQSGHFESIARIRRQADRDAAEVLALAAEYDIKRAIGFSRGARAIVGALGGPVGSSTWRRSASDTGALGARTAPRRGRLAA